jgi:hypothetical protein
MEFNGAHVGKIMCMYVGGHGGIKKYFNVWQLVRVVAAETVQLQHLW